MTDETPEALMFHAWNCEKRDRKVWSSECTCGAEKKDEN